MGARMGVRVGEGPGTHTKSTDSCESTEGVASTDGERRVYLSLAKSARKRIRKALRGIAVEAFEFRRFVDESYSRHLSFANPSGIVLEAFESHECVRESCSHHLSLANSPGNRNRKALRGIVVETLESRKLVEESQSRQLSLANPSGNRSRKALRGIVVEAFASRKLVG